MDPPQAVGGMANGARLERGWAERPADAVNERAGSPEGETALQPSFTFESFVTGDASSMAHAAALAVARGPALRCNPLFIHGDDGLGKTHLLHAIGNHVRVHRPELVTRCTSVERFLIEYIQMIKHSSGDEFRRRYRAVDVLLMDDVQIVAGLKGTMEELFHIFNGLFHRGTQLVLTCDLHPRSIPTLADRLMNRFASGLLVELQTPDVQTRLEILRRKAALEHFVVPDDVLQLLAGGLQGSIRELEGALVRLFALHRLMGAPLIPAVGEQVLSDVLPTTRPDGS